MQTRSYVYYGYDTIIITTDILHRCTNIGRKEPIVMVGVS